jgi:hypothetical protein
MPASLATEAVLAGPRLLARAPVAFLAWVGLRFVEQVVALAILLGAPFIGMAGVGSVWAALSSLPFEAVIIAAMFRGLLDPQAKGFAWLRLGAVEFKMAGVLVLARLAGLLVDLVALVGVAYVAYFLQQKALARAAFLIGSAAAALVFMRFAPIPAILVDRKRIDLGAALRASRGRYGLLAVIVLSAGALQKLLVAAPVGSGAAIPRGLNGLFSPLRLMDLAWVSLVGVAALAVMAGAVAAVWRTAKQTLD